jgi:cytochrome c556
MRSYVACFLACVTVPCLAASDDPLADLKKSQPKDVAALIERLAGCNHWSGEEPYDAERRKEILDAMADLKCDRLAADEAKALKRHAKNPKAIRALKQAKELSF